MANKKYYKWKGTMWTDAELLSEFARKRGISVEESKETINDLVEVIRRLLCVNTFVAIRKLGTFTVRIRKNSKVMDYNTGMMRQLPIIRCVVFKASQSWRNMLNKRDKKEVRQAVKEKKEELEKSVKL
jgi:nucleoid DNA-binding protein